MKALLAVLLVAVAMPALASPGGGPIIHAKPASSGPGPGGGVHPHVAQPASHTGGSNSGGNPSGTPINQHIGK